jgi:hypothetical protein
MQKLAAKVRFAPILLILVFGLAGCVRMDVNMNIKEDGSGTYKYSMGVSKQIAFTGVDQFKQQLEEAGKKLVEKNGGSYAVREESDYLYLDWNHDFKNVDELNTLIVASSQQDLDLSSSLGTGSFGDETPTPTPTSSTPTTNPLPLKASKNGNQIHITGELNFSTDSTSSENLGVDPATLFKDAYLRLTITFPHIVSHQGGEVNGNTITYTAKYGQKITVDVVGGQATIADTITSVGPLVGIGILVLAIVIGASVFVLRKRGQGQVAAAPGGDIPPTFVPPQGPSYPQQTDWTAPQSPQYPDVPPKD